MHRELRPSGLALVALAAFAPSLSCTSSETFPNEDRGGSGSGGASGTASTTGGAGTTGNGGTAGAAGTTVNGGAAGTTVNGGTTGTSGAAGTMGTSGAAGSIGGVGGSAAGGGGTDGGGAGSGGTTGGAAGNGGAGGVAAGNGGASGTGTGGAAGNGMMPSSGCGKAAGLTSGRASIDVNGKMREYILLVPPNYDQNKPYRLIFGWHPWGGSAQQTAQMNYFGLVAPSAGQAILVAPEGQEFQDGGLGWGNAGGEDIAFAHAMMDRFGAQLCVDQNRIFSTGFSFGAMFSFTLACTANSMQRAIAPMAGNTMTSGGCENSTRSVATMSFVGTTDSLLTVHRQAVQVFVQRDGCTTQKTPVTPSWCDGVASQFQPCTCVQYQGCKSGYPVIECEYNAGHQFAPSSGQTLWNFFSQF